MRSCAGPDIDLNYFCCYFIFLQVIHGQFVAGFYFTMLSNWLVKLAPFQPFALLQTEANNEFLTVIIILVRKARFYLDIFRRLWSFVDLHKPLSCAIRSKRGQTLATKTQLLMADRHKRTQNFSENAKKEHKISAEHHKAHKISLQIHLNIFPRNT